MVWWAWALGLFTPRWQFTPTWHPLNMKNMNIDIRRHHSTINRDIVAKCVSQNSPLFLWNSDVRCTALSAHEINLYTCIKTSQTRVHSYNYIVGHCIMVWLLNSDGWMTHSERFPQKKKQQQQEKQNTTVTEPFNSIRSTLDDMATVFMWTFWIKYKT